ncbi:MAG TPA: glycoside hydrolase family 71/99-like protein [Acidobacteriota bacterium]
MKLIRPTCCFLSLFLFIALSMRENLAAAKPASRPALQSETAVDSTTLNGKLMMGYQGWFLCPADGSPVNSWFHWFRRNQTPDASTVTVDFWPDTSELEPDELFITPFTRPDGSSAPLYSSYKQKTVLRHFQWMQQYGLDGVFLQRFSSELRDSRYFNVRNQVTRNVLAGAEAFGRVFAIMYDISGQSEATLVQDLKNDWSYLVDTLKITESSSYLKHKGKPVLAIWGFGFTDRPGTPEQVRQLISFFQSEAPEKYRVTLVGGVPSYWRTLTRDSKTDPAWAQVYRSFDVLSPWAVGRFSDEAGAERFRRDVTVPDLAETAAGNIEYLPVIFPGFSWSNLNKGPFNQIPRLGGRFYWKQVYNALSAGASMLYGAMFDEVDEGTAMFKMAPTPLQMPEQGRFVPLSVDGYALPSDWYLRVAGAAGKMLRHEIPLENEMPLPLPTRRRRP